MFELMDVLERKRQFNKKCFLLTFDDGFSEMYDIVRPILLEKGVSATFFVNSDFIDNKKICYQHMASVIVEHIKYGNVKKTKLNKIKEILSRHKLEIGWIELTAINYQKKHLLDEISRVLDIDFNNYLSENKPYLTSEQIKKLVNDGFTIGAHSIDHPLYENLTLEEQLHQTIESVNFVKEKFSLNYGVFAFPHMDAGVSKQFFSEIYKDDLVDLSFGTGGLISDVISRNLQRVSLENPPRPAEYNVPYNYLKKVYWNFLGKKQRSRFEV
ncbi:MAG: polysaccharide deacetylase family protein [Colwellia sp.]|nr:polysaccharide deacetylase family protein [Colwellia sp.]